MNLDLNQNLLTQVKPLAAPRPKGSSLRLVLEVLTVLLAGLFGYCVAAYLASSISLALVTVSALGFFAMSPFAMLFGTSTQRGLVVVLLETLAFLVFFHGSSPSILFASGLVMFIFSAWGNSSARKELENRLRFGFFSVARHKTVRLFTGFLLAGIILTMPQWRASALPIPERQFRQIYDQALRVLDGAYAGARLDVSTQEFAEGMARKQLGNEKSFAALSADLQEKAVREAAAIQIREASKSLKMEILPEMKVSDVLYVYVTNFVMDWKAGLGDSFVLFWALALFLFLRGLGFLVILASLILGEFIYQLCSALGLISVIGESATREKLILN